MALAGDEPQSAAHACDAKLSLWGHGKVLMRRKEKENEPICRGAGQAPQMESVDLFQGGIHHQHDEPYLGMVRRKPHG